MERQKKFIDLPVLETERLILRKVEKKDAKDMFEYANNLEVTKYLPWKIDAMDEVEEYIDKNIKNYKQRELGIWAIEYKEDRKMIGSIEYNEWNPIYQNANIGYVVHQEYHNKGIATEALKKVIDFGFENMELNRIQIDCVKENTASSRVMQKNGLIYEGTLRQAGKYKGNYVDKDIYSILRQEWKKEGEEQNE